MFFVLRLIVCFADCCSRAHEESRRQSAAEVQAAVAVAPPVVDRAAVPDGFAQMGPAGLADHLTNFVFGSTADPDRVSFRRKSQVGMAKHFLRGVSVLGSTMSVINVVTAVLCAWGDDEEEAHPNVDDLPAGLRDVVATWVTSLRS